jgi:hypothetical protein
MDIYECARLGGEQLDCATGNGRLLREGGSSRDAGLRPSDNDDDDNNNDTKDTCWSFLGCKAVR